MRKRKHESSLSAADFERAAGELRLLNAYAAFGQALLQGDIPARPPLSPEARKARRAQWHRQKAVFNVLIVTTPPDPRQSKITASCLASKQSAIEVARRIAGERQTVLPQTLREKRSTLR